MKHQIIYQDIYNQKVMDWKSLEDSTIYDSGFEDNHEYIK